MELGSSYSEDDFIDDDEYSASAGEDDFIDDEDEEDEEPEEDEYENDDDEDDVDDGDDGEDDDDDDDDSNGNGGDGESNGDGDREEDDFEDVTPSRPSRRDRDPLALTFLDRWLMGLLPRSGEGARGRYHGRLRQRETPQEMIDVRIGTSSIDQYDLIERARALRTAYKNQLVPRVDPAQIRTLFQAQVREMLRFLGSMRDPVFVFSGRGMHPAVVVISKDNTVRDDAGNYVVNEHCIKVNTQMMVSERHLLEVAAHISAHWMQYEHNGMFFHLRKAATREEAVEVAENNRDRAHSQYFEAQLARLSEKYAPTDPFGRFYTEKGYVVPRKQVYMCPCGAFFGSRRARTEMEGEGGHYHEECPIQRNFVLIAMWRTMEDGMEDHPINVFGFLPHEVVTLALEHQRENPRAFRAPYEVEEPMQLISVDTTGRYVHIHDKETEDYYRTTWYLICFREGDFQRKRHRPQEEDQ